MMALIIATTLVLSQFRQSLFNMLEQPWCKAVLLFICIVGLGCLWGPATPSEKWFVVEKYSKLLYLPILVVGLQNKKMRHTALHAFLFAMLLTSLLSILKSVGLLPFISINPDGVFRNHIMTGIMMSFAVYLSAVLFSRQQGTSRFFYVFIGLVFLYQNFFISLSRTGYIVCFLLTILFMLQFWGRKRALLGIIVVSVFFAIYYKINLSTCIPLHSKTCLEQVQKFQENRDQSLHLRIQFHHYAEQLFLRHPVFGGGTGSFTAIFRMEQPIPVWGPKLLEPHNLYWLIAAEFGVVGLLGLLFFLGSLLLTILRLDEMRPIGLAALFIFCVGNWSDSLLFYSGTGYFFIMFMALCLSEARTMPWNKTRLISC